MANNVIHTKPFPSEVSFHILHEKTFETTHIKTSRVLSSKYTETYF